MYINRRIALGVACLTLVGIAAFKVPDEEPLPEEAFVRISGDEITSILAGHTAIGTWGDDEYRQYFDLSGTTFYAPKGKRTTRGKWRLSEDGTRYESWWSGDEDNWEFYDVGRTLSGLVWVDPDGVHYPFEMVDGQQLVWPE